MQDKKLRSKILIIILSVITVIAIGVSIWALFFREKGPALTPDYAPQQTEENQIPIESDNGETLETPEGGGAVSLTYSKNVSIDISEKKAALLFGNPAKSSQDIILQIVIGETVIVQSGRLTPGNQITTLDLLKDKEKQLSEGGYNGKFIVLYYNRQSGEKAMVNTEIPITVNVTE